jgi:hypothetical protein
LPWNGLICRISSACEWGTKSYYLSISPPLKTRENSVFYAGLAKIFSFLHRFSAPLLPNTEVRALTPTRAISLFPINLTKLWLETKAGDKDC